MVFSGQGQDKLRVDVSLSWKWILAYLPVVVWTSILVPCCKTINSGYSLTMLEIAALLMDLKHTI